jgi:hypothetical protein
MSILLSSCYQAEQDKYPTIDIYSLTLAKRSQGDWKIIFPVTGCSSCINEIIDRPFFQEQMTSEKGKIELILTELSDDSKFNKTIVNAAMKKYAKVDSLNEYSDLLFSRDKVPRLILEHDGHIKFSFYLHEVSDKDLQEIASD